MSIINNMPNKAGMTVEGLIEEYKVYAGEEITAGGFVEFVEAIVGQKVGNSTDTRISEETGTAHSMSAVVLDDTRVFIAHSYNASSYDLYGIVITIDNTTITLGEDTALITATNYRAGYAVSVVLLDNDNVFITHNYGTNYYLEGVVCNINGTIITKGSSKSIDSGENASITSSTTALQGNKVFISYSRTSLHYLYGVVCTVSDVTFSTGSTTYLNKSNGVYVDDTDVTVLTNNNVFIAFSQEDDEYLAAIVCTVNGMTITTGDTKIINNSTSNTGYSISVVPLKDNKVFIAHSYTSSRYLYGIICMINGTVINCGTDTCINQEGDMSQFLSAIALEDNKVFIAHYYNNSAYLYGVVIIIDSTTLTLGTETSLVEGSYAAISPKALKLNSGNVLILRCRTTADYLNGQVFGIDHKNNIPILENITLLEYETQVTKPTSEDVNGIAKTSGIGGDTISIIVPNI